MPIHIQWDNEAKTTILCTVEGDFALPDDMVAAFQDANILAKTVEHEVGVIMDWGRAQLSAAFNTLGQSDTEGRRSILRGDFGRSSGVLNASGLEAFAMPKNPPPSRIGITVFIFPDSLISALKNALTPMLSFAQTSSRFEISSSLDDARKMITDYFQHGDL